MGGVVDFAKDLVVDAIKVAIVTVSWAEKTVEAIIKGEDPLKPLSDGVAEIVRIGGHTLRSMYENVLDPILGIDDTKFLGIKGGFFSTLGKGVKDLTYDHAYETVGIAVMVAVIYFAWAFAPELITTFSANTTLFAYEVLGATSTMGLLGTYYVTGMIASFGISAIMSGVIEGAVRGMYGDIATELYMYEKQQENIRLGVFGAIMGGGIFDQFAGGVLYNETQAGGELYSCTQDSPLDASVMGDFGIDKFTRSLEFPYVSYAGDLFDKQFSFLPIKD